MLSEFFGETIDDTANLQTIGVRVRALLLISLVDYKLAGPPKLWNGPPNFSRRGPEDPIICKPGYISALWIT